MPQLPPHHKHLDRTAYPLLHACLLLACIVSQLAAFLEICSYTSRHTQHMRAVCAGWFTHVTNLSVIFSRKCIGKSHGMHLDRHISSTFQAREPSQLHTGCVRVPVSLVLLLRTMHACFFHTRQERSIADATVPAYRNGTVMQPVLDLVSNLKSSEVRLWVEAGATRRLGCCLKREQQDYFVLLGQSIFFLLFTKRLL